MQFKELKTGTYVIAVINASMVVLSLIYAVITIPWFAIKY